MEMSHPHLSLIARPAPCMAAWSASSHQTWLGERRLCTKLRNMNSNCKYGGSDTALHLWLDMPLCQVTLVACHASARNL